MDRKYIYRIALAFLIIVGASLGFYFLKKGADVPPLRLLKVVPGTIEMVVNTNGVIEPLDRGEIYCPIDAFVKTIEVKEGSEVARGQLLMRLDAREIRAKLAEARAALLEARRQAESVVAGPPKEELSELEAAIDENELQSSQLARELEVEEALLAKGAVPGEAVEKLRKQRDLLQIRIDGLKKRRSDLLTRYSNQEKEWERDKVKELTRQVSLLEQQLRMESVPAPRNGFLYSLAVKPGAYIVKGQLLGRIYSPGKVRLRAYVDEPDLGRIRKGQKTLVEWDGLPDRQWTGVVERPADQVVSLNNRTIGYVLCSINGDPRELIPNLNVKVEIVTDSKSNALVVPRSAVFSSNGKPAVLLSDGTRTTTKQVVLGLVSPEEIEIVKGISAGSSVVLNHADVLAAGSR